MKKKKSLFIYIISFLFIFIVSCEDSSDDDESDDSSSSSCGSSADSICINDSNIEEADSSDSNNTTGKDPLIQFVFNSGSSHYRFAMSSGFVDGNTNYSGTSSISGISNFDEWDTFMYLTIPQTVVTAVGETGEYDYNTDDTSNEPDQTIYSPENSTDVYFSDETCGGGSYNITSFPTAGNTLVGTFSITVCKESNNSDTLDLEGNFTITRDTDE